LTALEAGRGGLQLAEVTNIYLVRHGEAQLPWSEAENSGLSAAGKPQAEDVIEALGDVPSLRVVSSPLQRAQETALPLSRHFGVTAEIDDRFRDVPLDENRAIRKAWLVDVASMCWHEVDDAVTAWRNSAWNAMLSAQRDTVIFTHFMLINAMVSRASADERLACFEPGYASITRLAVTEQQHCRVVAMGQRL
jgi:probable phosphoglycerate mutase